MGKETTEVENYLIHAICKFCYNRLSLFQAGTIRGGCISLRSNGLKAE